MSKGAEGAVDRGRDQAAAEKRIVRDASVSPLAPPPGQPDGAGFDAAVGAPCAPAANGVAERGDTVRDEGKPRVQAAQDAICGGRDLLAPRPGLQRRARIA